MTTNEILIPITIVDVIDDCALSTRARDQIAMSYPHAKRASLKSGGNFPFLSRAAEVNLHIKLHLKQFDGDLSCQPAALDQ